MTDSTKTLTQGKPVSVNAVMPTREQMQALLDLPNAPVLMFNLVKLMPDGGA